MSNDLPISSKPVPLDPSELEALGKAVGYASQKQPTQQTGVWNGHLVIKNGKIIHEAKLTTWSLFKRFISGAAARDEAQIRERIALADRFEFSKNNPDNAERMKTITILDLGRAHMWYGKLNTDAIKNQPTNKMSYEEFRAIIPGSHVLSSKAKHTLNLVFKFIRGKSDIKDLRFLFQCLPAGVQLPKDCLKKAEQACRQAFGNNPRDFEAIALFLSKLPKITQSNLLKTFITTATPSQDITAFLKTATPEAAEKILSQLTGRQLVDTFPLLSEEFREQHRQTIEAQFKKIAESNSFPDSKRLHRGEYFQSGSLADLLNFISPKTLLTTNWMNPKSLQAMGSESFFLMLNQLYKYVNSDNFQDLPADIPHFNRQALQEFRTRLPMYNFIEEGSSFSDAPRNSGIRKKFDNGLALFNGDRSLQYVLHRKITDSLNAIIEARFPVIAPKLNEDLSYQPKLNGEENYLTELFSNIPEVAAHGVMAKTAFGRLIPSYVSSEEAPIELRRSILNHLPHALLVGKKALVDGKKTEELLGKDRATWGTAQQPPSRSHFQTGDDYSDNPYW